MEIKLIHFLKVTCYTSQLLITQCCSFFQQFLQAQFITFMNMIWLHAPTVLLNNAIIKSHILEEKCNSKTPKTLEALLVQFQLYYFLTCIYFLFLPCSSKIQPMKEVKAQKANILAANWMQFLCFQFQPPFPSLSAGAQVFHSKKRYTLPSGALPSRSLILWCICRQFSFSLQFSTKGQQLPSKKHEPRVFKFTWHTKI